MMDGQESWTSTVTSTAVSIPISRLLTCLCVPTGVVSGPWTPNNQDSIPKGLEEDAVVVEEFIEAKLETKVSVRRRPQKDDKASKCVWTAEDFFGGREACILFRSLFDEINSPLKVMLSRTLRSMCVLFADLLEWS
eukprot:GHVS01069857.1.p1 GENE.GHVS01069857.1~~GHVS01069857.1.p1  ORF type:complete len:136 (+),score=11.18 GHVS01069857.1:437-844(+)